MITISLVHNDNNYEDFKIDFEEIYNFHQENRVLHPEDKLTFGKYKGKCIRNIADKDLEYLRWLNNKCEGYSIDLEELKILLTIILMT